MTKILFGFHAVGIRLKTAPRSVLELHLDATRRDPRMQQFAARAGEAGVRIVDSDGARLDKLAGNTRHQGVVARVDPLQQAKSIDDTLDLVEGPPLLLVLDGVTDPQGFGYTVAEAPPLCNTRLCVHYVPTGTDAPRASPDSASVCTYVDPAVATTPKKVNTKTSPNPA